MILKFAFKDPSGNVGLLVFVHTKNYPLQWFKKVEKKPTKVKQYERNENKISSMQAGLRECLAAWFCVKHEKLVGCISNQNTKHNL